MRQRKLLPNKAPYGLPISYVMEVNNLCFCGSLPASYLTAPFTTLKNIMRLKQKELLLTYYDEYFRTLMGVYQYLFFLQDFSVRL